MNSTGKFVRSENSVQSENAELTTIRETIVLSMSNSLFVALLALIASGFRTRAACRQKFWPFVTNWPFSKPTRRVICVSLANSQNHAVNRRLIKAATMLIGNS